MTLRTLITRSLKHYWRTNLAVAAGVAVATAVLVGSFLVGDSVNGSLRDLALGRVGRVEQALTARRPFRESLARDLCERASLDNDTVTPALVLDASAKFTDPETDPAHPRTVVVPKVTLYGIRDAFWAMSGSGSDVKLSGREAAVNRHLADALGIRTGDEIVCTVARSASAPVESVFGRRGRDDTVRQVRLTVKAVIPDEGAGRFTLRSDRPRPRNVFVPLDGLQHALWYDEKPDRERRINTVFIASTDNVTDALHASLTLDDYDLELVKSDGLAGQTLRSKRLVLSPRVLRAIDKSPHAALHQSVYLANVIRRASGGEETGVPYSLLGIRHGAGSDGMKPDDIVLIDWAADDLGVKPGDEVACEFYIADARGEL
ncbi:MAG TPA: ABC transporter permease, partial [Planctomycetota bacterium]|nr:ABC transporter permease [Planctomycetota bacterium]